MTIGKSIQSARKDKGLSQKELGALLGVSGSMIGQYENDLRNPKFETLERIAEALDHDVWDFIGGGNLYDSAFLKVEKIIQDADISEESLALWLLTEKEKKEILEKKADALRARKKNAEWRRKALGKVSGNIEEEDSREISDKISEKERVEYRRNRLLCYFDKMDDRKQRMIIEIAETFSQSGNEDGSDEI